MLWEIEHERRAWEGLGFDHVIEDAIKTGQRPALADPQSPLSKLMVECWRDDPDLRPAFATIHQHLESIKRSIPSERPAPPPPQPPQPYTGSVRSPEMRSVANALPANSRQNIPETYGAYRANSAENRGSDVPRAHSMDDPAQWDLGQRILNLFQGQVSLPFVD